MPAVGRLWPSDDDDDGGHHADDDDGHHDDDWQPREVTKFTNIFQPILN